MKKAKLLFLLLLSCAFSNIYGQAFVKGTNVITLGLGTGGQSDRYDYSSRSPTISFQYEKGLWNVGPGVISLGGYAGFATYKNFGYNNARSSNTVIGARGAYHFNGWNQDNEYLKKLDVYGGLMVYYNINSNKYGSDSSDSYLDAGLYVGGRYFFKDNLGAFAEISSAVSFFTVGLALKF